jgi:hypothetical protein
MERIGGELGGEGKRRRLVRDEAREGGCEGEECWRGLERMKVAVEERMCIYTLSAESICSSLMVVCRGEDERGKS